MQISTRQFYEQSVRNMQETQMRAAEANEKLATGKAVLRPSDDTTVIGKIDDLDRAVNRMGTYNDNIDVAMNRLELEEVAMTSASDILIRLKELGLQAANDTISSSDRRIIATEVSGLRDELLSLANARDASGRYIFAGSKESTKPFAVNDEGVMTYFGDTKSTSIEVGENRHVQKNRNGLDVFTSVSREAQNGTLEAVGFFEALTDFEEGLMIDQITRLTVAPEELSADSGELVINGVRVSAAADPVDVEALAVLINAETDRTNVIAEISEDGELIIENQIGHEGENIEFGDSAGIIPAAVGTLYPNESSAVLSRSVQEIDSLHDSLSLALGKVGGAMQAAQRQMDINLDSELSLKQLQSSIKDVDFATTISEFNAELMRLEAAQSSFAKISRLSLFEFI